MPCDFTIGTGDLAVDFEVYKDGFRFGIDDRNRLYIGMIYQVDGAVAFKAANALKGVGDYANSGSNTFPNPHRHPTTPSLWCLSVDGVMVGPSKPDDQGVTSDYAHLTVTYGTLDVDPFGDVYAPVFDGDIIPYSSWSSQGALEIVRATPTDLKYETTLGPADDADVSVPVPTQEYQLTRGMIPASSYPAFKVILDGLMGTVNDAVIFLCDVGTLLLENWSARDMRDGNGNLVYEFDIMFRWRAVDHNAILVPGTLDQFERLLDASDALVLKHQYANFTPLKTFGVV